MADSCFDSEESESGEDREHSLSRREIDELIDAVIKPPTASRKVRVKKNRGRSLVLHEQQSLRPTDAELRAKKARMHAKNQELDRELESVKADFHNSGLVNPMICRSLYKDYKYTRKVCWQKSTCSGSNGTGSRVL